jgi:UDP-4-amino-4,6-dideoxy-N-acetyl-beta-L-altrosamine transaminase
MKKYIPYGCQDISTQDIEAVSKVLRSDFLTQGSAVGTFERDLMHLTGARFALAVNSATSALHIACMALGVGEGDIVWTSPISFVASSNCALYCGAKIDFVDIDPKTNNISVSALSKKLELASEAGQLPKAVIPVHLSGFSADMKKIFELSKKYDFKIIEDASHAIGGTYNGKQVGSCEYSDFCIFSFHPVKIITTGEGGALLTNQERLADQAELLRSHGITKNPEFFQAKDEGDWYYEQQDLGFNYRMTDIQAALGSSQLKRLNDFILKRKEIFKYYQTLLKDLPLVLPSLEQGEVSSNHLFIIKLKLDEVNISHQKLFSKLRESGIGVNLHYIPIYKHPYYRELLQIDPMHFPESERYYSSAISLPIFYKLDKADMEYICHTLKELLDE